MFSFLITHSCCLDFNVNMSVSIEVELAGFQNTTDLIQKLEKTTTFYLSEKKFYKFSVGYNIKFNELQEGFLRKYEDDMKKDMSNAFSEERRRYYIRQDGLLPNLFTSHLSQRKSSNKESPDYFLYLVNSKELDNVDIYYESANEKDECFVLNTNAAFCHLSLEPNSYEITLFRRISEFLDTIIMPNLPEGGSDQLSRLRVPIVTFGPLPKTINIQNRIVNLLPEDFKTSCIVTVAQCSLYDYPLIAAGVYSSEGDDESVMSLIQKSAQVLGPSFAEAFSSNKGEKILPTFIFEEEDIHSHRIIIEGSTAAVFSSYGDVERLTLAAVANNILTTAPAFSGHHPMLPNGGSEEFSPIIAEGLHRVMILNDINYALTVYDETVDILKQIQEMDLHWVNMSYYKSQLCSILTYVNKTSNRFTSNYLAKASSSAFTARTKADDLKNEVAALQTKIDIFGMCCPIIKYVHKETVKASWIVYAITILIVIWSVSKFVQIYKRKKYGYIPAAFDF
jgi:hypothetical protein